MEMKPSSVSCCKGDEFADSSPFFFAQSFVPSEGHGDMCISWVGW